MESNPSKNFFILGLPRHRTTWLSTFFTMHGLRCYHDLSQYCRDIDDYIDMLQPYYGDSSTGMGLLGIDVLYPDSPRIIIEGAIAKSLAWIETVLSPNTKEYSLICDHLVLLDDILYNMEGYHVPFERIDMSLKSMLDYVCTGLNVTRPFLHIETEILKSCRIEPKDPLNCQSMSVTKVFVDSCLKRVKQIEENRDGLELPR